MLHAQQFHAVQSHRASMSSDVIRTFSAQPGIELCDFRGDEGPPDFVRA